MRKVSPPGLLPVTLCILILSLACPLTAQVRFQHTYNLKYLDCSGGESVRQTADTGYIIAGFTDFSGSENIWLIKTDPNGDTLWTRTYGSGYDVRGSTPAPTTHGSSRPTPSATPSGPGPTAAGTASTATRWHKPRTADSS
jgi:hypothetical protein